MKSFFSVCYGSPLLASDQAPPLLPLAWAKGQNNERLFEYLQLGGINTLTKKIISLHTPKVQQFGDNVLLK